MAKIKICGLTRKEDIEAVNQYRPDYVGFVFAPSRRQVTEEQAGKLSGMLDPTICPVGVFVNDTEERICRIVSDGIIRMVQLHGQETAGQVESLRRRLDQLAPQPGTPGQPGQSPGPSPFIPIIRAVRMDQEDSLKRLKEWLESRADFLLLDTGPGGTGQTFDHRLLEQIDYMKKPWFLAGGMNPDNAAEAAGRFSPYAIDVSSGVETDGKKDRLKIEKIIRSIRK